MGRWGSGEVKTRGRGRRRVNIKPRPGECSEGENWRSQMTVWSRDEPVISSL